MKGGSFEIAACAFAFAKKEMAFPGIGSSVDFGRCVIETGGGGGGGFHADSHTGSTMPVVQNSLGLGIYELSLRCFSTCSKLIRAEGIMRLFPQWYVLD